jgi:hypothetical protein
LIQAQFKSPKHLHQTLSKFLKYLQQTTFSLQNPGRLKKLPKWRNIAQSGHPNYEDLSLTK